MSIPIVYFLNSVCQNQIKMVRYRKVLRPFQEEIYSDRQWENLIEKPKLIIVEAYSEWSGPCVVMKPHLRSLMHHVGDAKIHFAIANSARITFLEKFRNRCEPTWLFIMNGKLVNVLFGPNVPKLIRTVREQLKIDVEVKSGHREQVELNVNDVPEPKEEEEIVVKIEEKVEEVKKSTSKGSFEIIEYNYCPF